MWAFELMDTFECTLYRKISSTRGAKAFYNNFEIIHPCPEKPIVPSKTSQNLAPVTRTCASRDLNIVARVGVSKTPPPPLSKVKLPAAAAMKNHVLNVFDSGWQGKPLACSCQQMVTQHVHLTRKLFSGKVYPSMLVSPIH